MTKWSEKPHGMPLPFCYKAFFNFRGLVEDMNILMCVYAVSGMVVGVFTLKLYYLQFFMCKHRTYFSHNFDPEKNCLKIGMMWFGIMSFLGVIFFVAAHSQYIILERFSLESKGQRPFSLQSKVGERSLPDN